MTVTYVGTRTKACTIAGTTIQIEFLQDFGDLPLLVASSASLTHTYSQTPASISVTSIRKGTKGEGLLQM